MDNTELHYLTYDSDEIWNEMMLNYVEAGGDIVYPGDEKEMLMRGVLSDIVQVLAGVDNALRMQTLRYAVGDYLDVIGEARGCERIAASTATTTVTIVTNATGKSETLSAGTALTSDGEVFYLLSEDLVLTGYKQTVTVEIEARDSGSAGNGLLAGTEMSLYISNPGVNSIIVAEDASGGNEKEEDDAYRERIREYGLASVTTGPAQQYENVAESVSSLIVDAKALNIGDGQVGVYLIISGDSGKTAIIEDVAETLNDTSVRPLTDKVTVYEATDITYVLNVEFTSEASSSTLAAISEAVSEYQEWQDNTIGRAFNPDRLMAAIYTAGATRVIWGTDSSFNGTSVIAYTEVEQNERCKGTINLTAV